MHDVVVIGAGPSGLVATKEMIERGFGDVVCFEKSKTIGGTFSESYEGLHLTSSATFSMFSDFDVTRADHNKHWTKEEAVAYWTRYADHFAVLPRIRYDVEVSKLEQLPDQSWQIHLASGEIATSKRIVCCTGTNTRKRFPDWADQATNVEVAHSQDYQSPHSYKAQNVLVIGGGESASDIAYEISKTAKQVTVSLRNGTGWVTPRSRNGVAADNSTNRLFWKLPRHLGPVVSTSILGFDQSQRDPLNTAIHKLNSLVPSPLGIFGSYGTKSLSLPKAMVENGAQIVRGVSEIRDGGKSIEFECGAVLEEIDAIVFCTGYINQVPFLDGEHAVGSPRELHKHVFHPEIGNSLAFVGLARPGFGAQFPIVEIQSRWVSHVFASDVQLPSCRKMKEDAARDAKHYETQFGDTGKRITALVDFHRYMDNIGGMLGCVPSLGRVFLGSPKLWKHILFGPTQGTQFRLAGLGAKPELARSILLSLPVSRVNHIVKIALKQRLLMALPLRRFTALRSKGIASHTKSQET